MKKILFASALLAMTIGSCNSDPIENEQAPSTVDSLAVETHDSLATTTPMLGEFVKIMIGSNKYQETIKFYEILGWEIEAQNDEPWNWTSMYDGSMSLLINEDTMNYMGPAYHSKDALNVYKTLKDMNIEPGMEMSGPDGTPWFNVYFSPDSLGFSIINEAHEVKEDIQIADLIANPKEKLEFPNDKAGIFQEYAMAVENVDSSLAYYTALGFESQGKHTEGVPYPYAIGYDGQLTLGMHETRGMWSGQLFTYSGHSVERNDSVVEELKENGFDNIEALEYGGQAFPGNYLITDPAGNIFFLTTDFSAMKK